MISKYFDFKMSDEKAILVQVHELQVIVNKLCAVKIDLRFVLPGDEHKVCRLVKSLYGLKQAPKQCIRSLTPSFSQMDLFIIYPISVCTQRCVVTL